MKKPDGVPIINFNKEIKYGDYPIHIAVRNDYIPTIKLMTELVNANGNLLLHFNKKDDKGCNILHIAVESSRHAMIDFLLSVNNKILINLNEPNNDGLTPAHIAVINNRPEILMKLMKMGADINIEIRGKKPIDLARHTSIVDFYKALDKRNNLISTLDLIKSGCADINNIEKVKEEVMELFQDNYTKFLFSEEITEKVNLIKSGNDKNIHQFFSRQNEGEMILIMSLN